MMGDMLPSRSDSSSFSSTLSDQHWTSFGVGKSIQATAVLHGQRSGSLSRRGKKFIALFRRSAHAVSPCQYSVQSSVKGTPQKMMIDYVFRHGV